MQAATGADLQFGVLLRPGLPRGLWLLLAAGGDWPCPTLADPWLFCLGFLRGFPGWFLPRFDLLWLGDSLLVGLYLLGLLATLLGFPE